MWENCLLCTFSGSGPQPCTGGWRIEALPPLPALEGSSLIPPLLCQLGKWNWESLLASVLCLDLPHSQFLAPWAKCTRTPSLAVPLGGPNWDPSPPFGCAESKVTSGRRDGEPVLFAASFLPLPGRGAGQAGLLPELQAALQVPQGPLDNIQRR